jgi:hypothetical protein
MELRVYRSVSQYYNNQYYNNITFVKFNDEFIIVKYKDISYLYLVIIAPAKMKDCKIFRNIRRRKVIEKIIL